MIYFKKLPMKNYPFLLNIFIDWKKTGYYLLKMRL